MKSALQHRGDHGDRSHQERSPIAQEPESTQEPERIQGGGCVAKGGGGASSVRKGLFRISVLSVNCSAVALNQHKAKDLFLLCRILQAR
jgi:hypothetical protein